MDLRSFVFQNSPSSNALFEMQNMMNYAVPRLLKQYTKAIAGIGAAETCKYREPQEDGQIHKCAVGHLIEDHAYDESFENNSAVNIQVLFALVQSNMLDQNIFTDMNRGVYILFFLRDMQRVHDSHEPDFWLQQFELLANNYKLDWQNVLKAIEVFNADG